MSEIITNDTVTKNELSEALFDQVGLNKREAKDMIDAFFDRIGESLQAGVEVKKELEAEKEKPVLVVVNDDHAAEHKEDEHDHHDDEHKTLN